MSKEMKNFSTGAKREDKTGKGRCDLLPPGGADPLIEAL